VLWAEIVEFNILDPTATIVGTAPPSKKHHFSISFRELTGRILLYIGEIQCFESLRHAHLKLACFMHNQKKSTPRAILLLASFSCCFLMGRPPTPTIEWQTKVASGLYSGLGFTMHSAQDVWKFEQFELLSCKRTQTKSSFARIFFDMFCVS
jgi:hypothetical protein